MLTVCSVTGLQYKYSNQHQPVSRYIYILIHSLLPLMATAMVTNTHGNGKLSSHPHSSHHPHTITVDIPVIQEQPQSQRVDIGQSVTLSCIASGCQPLEYQWFKDSSALLYGRCSSITIDQVQLADQGEYTCSVKSSIGTSVLSVPAKVTGMSVCLSVS